MHSWRRVEAVGFDSKTGRATLKSRVEHISNVYNGQFRGVGS